MAACNPGVHCQRQPAHRASQLTAGAEHASACAQWVQPKGKSALPESAWQPKDLLPRLKRLPSKRLLHMPNVTQDALDFRLFFDPGADPPPGCSSPELGTWTVSGALPCPAHWPCHTPAAGCTRLHLGRSALDFKKKKTPRTRCCSPCLAVSPSNSAPPESGSTPGAGLPPGFSSPELGTWTVAGALLRCIEPGCHPAAEPDRLAALRSLSRSPSVSASAQDRPRTCLTCSMSPHLAHLLADSVPSTLHVCCRCSPTPWPSTHQAQPCAGIKAVLDKHRDARLSVHFRADISGLLVPESADATAEVTEEYDVQVPLSSAGDSAGNATAAEVSSLPRAPCTSTKTPCLFQQGRSISRRHGRAPGPGKRHGGSCRCGQPRGVGSQTAPAQGQQRRLLLRQVLGHASARWRWLLTCSSRAHALHTQQAPCREPCKHDSGGSCRSRHCLSARGLCRMHQQTATPQRRPLLRRPWRLSGKRGARRSGCPSSWAAPAGCALA